MLVLGGVAGQDGQGVGELRNVTDDVARRRRIKCFVIVAGWVVQRSVLQLLLFVLGQATRQSNCIQDLVSGRWKPRDIE